MKIQDIGRNKVLTQELSDYFCAILKDKCFELAIDGKETGGVGLAREVILYALHRLQVESNVQQARQTDSIE